MHTSFISHDRHNHIRPRSSFFCGFFLLLFVVKISCLVLTLITNTIDQTISVKFPSDIEVIKPCDSGILTLSLSLNKIS